MNQTHCRAGFKPVKLALLDFTWFEKKLAWWLAMRQAVALRFDLLAAFGHLIRNGRQARQADQKLLFHGFASPWVHVALQCDFVLPGSCFLVGQ